MEGSRKALKMLATAMVGLVLGWLTGHAFNVKPRPVIRPRPLVTVAVKVLCTDEQGLQKSLDHLSYAGFVTGYGEPGISTKDLKGWSGYYNIKPAEYCVIITEKRRVGQQSA